MRKINGVYYFIYSSLKSHELCYATSNRPDGGFVYGGTIVSIVDIGFNGSGKPINILGKTHGSVVKIKDRYYVFYHRHTDRHMCCGRQACAEEIFVADDGSISQVEITSCGLNGAPLCGKGTYRASIACNLWREHAAEMTDPDREQKNLRFTQDKADGDITAKQYLTDFSNGAYVGYKYFNYNGDENHISLLCRSNATGSINVLCDDPFGAPIAKITVTPSDEWSAFESDICFPQGKHALFLTFKGEGALDILSVTVE